MNKKVFPRLVFCDVDGTLIDSSESITPAFDELKQLIEENEIRFSLASGRSYDQLKIYVDKLGIKHPVLINNGAGARISGQVLWDDFFPAKYVRAVVEAADRLDMAIFMCGGDHEVAYRYNVYIQREIDEFERYNHFHIPLESEWSTLQFERVMITDPQKPGRVDRLIPFLVPFAEQLTILRHDDRHIDVMRKGISKGSALRRLAEQENIPMEEILVIGDGLNDMEIMEQAGVGAAVANACEPLKEIADYVCREKYIYGVIEAVRNFCRRQ